MLKNKTVAVCVSGGIAAYKACEIVSRLIKLRASVHVVMTENAKEFVSPLTFETLSNNKVISQMFRPDREWEAEHISLAKKADLFLVAPATANVIGKLANGIADDFLSTTIMAAKCPVIFAPAMNTAMLENPSYIKNESVLKERGYIFVDSAAGRLACGDLGKGRLAEVEDIINAVIAVLMPRRDFIGKKALITLGATREYIDPVRYISNESSGKMGLSLINALAERGAEVTAVSGFVSVDLSKANCNTIKVKTAREMLDSVNNLMDKTQFDYMIFAAAVADYRVDAHEKNKIKSQELTLKLVKNTDIACAAGQRKGGAKTVVFSAETENLIANARKKMERKSADMVVANDVTLEGAGFNTDTNIAVIITKSTEIKLEKMQKSELAHIILDKIIEQ